jgi:hypothetical protein
MAKKTKDTEIRDLLGKKREIQEELREVETQLVRLGESASNYKGKIFRGAYKGDGLFFISEIKGEEFEIININRQDPQGYGTEVSASYYYQDVGDFLEDCEELQDPHEFYELLNKLRERIMHI